MWVPRRAAHTLLSTIPALHPITQKGPAMAKNTAQPTDPYFSFTLDGVTHVLPVETKTGMSPRFVRLNRRRDEVDYFMTLLETLCGMGDDETLELTDEQKEIGASIIDALDGASWPDHQRIQAELGKHLDANLGE